MDVLGRELALEALVSMVLQLEVGSNEGTVSLDIVEVERVEIELTAKNDANVSDEPAMIGMLEQRLVGELIGKLGDGLGGFEIPEVDLSGAVGLPPGTAVLRVSVDHFEHADGVTYIVTHPATAPRGTGTTMARLDHAETRRTRVVDGVTPVDEPRGEGGAGRPRALGREPGGVREA